MVAIARAEQARQAAGGDGDPADVEEPGVHREKAPPLDGIEDPGARATLAWLGAFVASDFGDPSAAEAMVG